MNVQTIKNPPIGIWLVEVDCKKGKKGRSPYHVAVVTLNRAVHKFIVVGGHFHWGREPLLAYTGFERRIEI